MEQQVIKYQIFFDLEALDWQTLPKKLENSGAFSTQTPNAQNNAAESSEYQLPHDLALIELFGENVLYMPDDASDTTHPAALEQCDTKSAKPKKRKGKKSFNNQSVAKKKKTTEAFTLTRSICTSDSTASRKYSYNCPLCKKTYRRTTWIGFKHCLDTHFLTKHPGQTQLLGELLIYHEDLATKDLIGKCQTCDFVTNKGFTHDDITIPLIDHYQKHHKDIVKLQNFTNLSLFIHKIVEPNIATKTTTSND